MLKLCIHTGIRENYGAHDWDGTGTCPEYWKNKGGDAITVICKPSEVSGLVAKVRKLIERSDEYFIERVRSWFFNPINAETPWRYDWDRPIVLNASDLSEESLEKARRERAATFYDFYNEDSVTYTDTGEEIRKEF